MKDNILNNLSFVDMSTVFSFTINDSHTNRKMPGRGFELATNTGSLSLGPSRWLAI